MSPSVMISLLAYGSTVGVALAAPVGPINVEIIRRGLTRGFLHGWLTGLGAVTADTLYAFLVVLGWAQFADHRGVRIVLYLLGGIVLVRTGWSSVRDAWRPVEIGTAATPRSLRREFSSGLMMAAFNPVGIVYWLTVGAGLAADAVRRSGPSGAPVLVTGVTVGIVIWVTVLSVVTQVSRRFVVGRGLHYVTAIGGFIVMAFGVWFLWQVIVEASRMI